MITRENLWLRAQLIQTTRRFFLDQQGYLEVDTPILIPTPAPEAYIEPVRAGDWYLQTSPELCMKRLLAEGHPRIFQISKCFRNRERGRLHLPEFTMLEWYRAGIDYHDLMTECEAYVGCMAEALGLGRERSGADIKSGPPWQRITVAEAFGRYAQVSALEALAADSFDEIMVRDIEPNLGLERPVFLHDYPAIRGPLAKRKNDDRDVVERFELYIDGVELANGFTELNDPVEQRHNFESELKTIKTLGRQTGPMPERFLEALPRMPPAAGIALGIDRLLMVLTGASYIDEVVAFTPESL